mgnify:FL=1
MSIVLLLAGILAGWLLGNIVGMAVVVFMFWLRKDSRFIKPSLKAEVWRLRHPIKNMKLMVDSVVICGMQLDDKIFKMMLQHKYRSNQKRMNRIQYEIEEGKKWSGMTMKPFGQVLECTYKSLNLSSAYKYTPRRVVYEDYDKIWEIK